jgi:hypothetical protein
MFSFQEYIIGWGVYLFAVIALLFVFWRMTRFITWGYARDCIRLLGAVFLLLPITIDSSAYYWAPAWIKALLNIIFANPDVFWPIARLFILALCSTYLVYFLLSFFISLVNKGRTNMASNKASNHVSDNVRKEPKISAVNV